MNTANMDTWEIPTHLSSGGLNSRLKFFNAPANPPDLSASTLADTIFFTYIRKEQTMFIERERTPNSSTYQIKMHSNSFVITRYSQRHVRLFETVKFLQLIINLEHFL
jgi:hypothetical protein